MSSNTGSTPVDNNTSTVKAAIDSVTGTAQEMLGKVIGSSGDEAKGQMRQGKAHAENEASHSTAKIPGFTASAEGTVTKDSKDRTTGQWNQTMGSTKEMVGGLLGSENLKAKGRQQNLEGQRQEAQAQVGDYVSGVGDRIQGTIGSAAAGLTGDKEGQKHYEQMHASGKTQQRGVEYDIQKKAEAERNSRLG